MTSVQIIDKTGRIKLKLLDAEAYPFLCNDEVQALNSVEKMQPSVVILNYELRKEQTLDYIKLILNASSGSKIVVIADELSEEKILDCLIAGAKGYQSFKQLDEHINKLIKVVDAGGAWVTRRMVAKLLNKIREEKAVSGFKSIENKSIDKKASNPVRAGSLFNYFIMKTQKHYSHKLGE